MKILLVRFSSIGDLVLTSPIIRCLKQQLANAEIHYLTKNIFKDIWSAYPYLTKVYGIDTEVFELKNELISEQYDLMIDLHDSIRSHQVASLLKCKTFRYNKQRFKRFMLIQFKINWLNNHIVDRYFSAVEKLNVINDGKGLDYFIRETDEIGFAQLPFTHIAGFGVLVIGAKHYTKQIPFEKLQEICQKTSIPLILIGGMEDAYKGAQLEAIDKYKLYNACGNYSINQSASVIRKAKFVITPDTGMMHIAAALNKRIISIFGGTEKRLGFAPYQNNAQSAMIENTTIKCRPCHKHGLDDCPKNHFRCMLDLDMQKVIDII